MSKSKVAIFIFRRDLRIQDNTVLNMLSTQGYKIIPIFIFCHEQLTGSYASPNAIQFMHECLRELKSTVPKLSFYLTQGLFQDSKVLDKVLKQNQAVDAVAFNGDTTPFSIKRDMHISEWCKYKNIKVLTTYDDYCLVNPSTMEKPYQVFTAFYKKYASLAKNIKPLQRIKHNFIQAHGGGKVDLNKTLIKYYKPNKKLAVHGGRTLAVQILKNINTKHRDYATKRDIVSIPNGTTKLSAYLKFGCISVREALDASQKARNMALTREFYWRAFYDCVAYHYPHVLMGKSLRPKYDKIKWDCVPSNFKAWKQGKTGFPIVDAGMRQLNSTGYMHNRVRMIVASFLIKDLHCDWRHGERYFAQHLVDYHPSANSGGWQWASGGGADAQQYNRIFNPWLQSAKFDKDCSYIKKWIPELSNIPPADIHSWYKTHKTYSKDIRYPAPIVDHSIQIKKVKAIYSKALYKN